MSHVLQNLLGNDHPLFVRNMGELEKATGNAGVDTKLIGDITEKAHQVMRELHIDPADSSGKELYLALNAAATRSKLEKLLQDTHYVLINFEDGPVSFCLFDVIDNAHHELSYENRKYDHGQRHLRMEIVKRYAQHDRTDNKIVHNLTGHAAIKQPDDENYANLSKMKLFTEKIPTILAIGDIFTDAFIKLSESVVKLETDENDEKWVKIPFGGRPPYDDVEIVQSVGPSPNSAVSFARLGIDSSLLTWLGDDEAGADSMAHLQNEKVHTDLVTTKPNTKSNYYYVLRVGAERTILTKDESFDYKWIEPAQPPDWIYLASISEESWQLHEDLLGYLENNQTTKLAFQPGTFHFKWGKEKLKKIYKRSHIIILNREEAVDVTGAPYDSLQELTTELHILGPDIVVVTDGPNGSYASYDGKLMKMPNYPDPAPPYDRTGAGDAFASTIVAALAQGETIETALQWAPINSMNVVQHLGAQKGLLTKQEIAQHLMHAPNDYQLKKI